MMKLSSGKSSGDHPKFVHKTPTKNEAYNREPVREASNIVAHFSADSVKMIAESVGISNLADDAARMLADDITLKLKSVVQDAIKYASHGRRTIINNNDINYAMKNKNVAPMLSFCDKELLPFRYASGGGRELFFQEEKEVELTDIISMASQAKLPQDVALKCHWLSIEGVQPAIPENPPPLSKDRQRIESIDPSLVLKLQSTPNNPFSNTTQNKFITQKKKKTVEVIRVKQYATHELSVEQQLYYKEITEACVGSDEVRRSEALQSLTYDSGLHQMLPRLCTFISEGVKVNVVQNNLALLIYLMRMVKALLDNHNFYLEKYLHELIPTVITCIVSKQLCMRPELDNHWALRDFGSRLLAQICRNFNTNTNNIQVRVTQLLSQSLDKERIALSSLYGAISCLCEMGSEIQRTFLVRRLKSISERVRTNLEGVGISSADKSAAEHIKHLIVRVLPPTLKNIRPPPDILEEYKTEYGYLGSFLHLATANLRSSSGPTTSRAQTTSQQSGSQLPVYRSLSSSAASTSAAATGQTSQAAHKFAIMQQSSPASTSSAASPLNVQSGSGSSLFRFQTKETSLIASSPTTSAANRFLNMQTPPPPPSSSAVPSSSSVPSSSTSSSFPSNNPN